MAPRHTETSLLTPATTSPRRSRLTLVIVTLAFLSAVVFIAWQILPEAGLTPARRAPERDPLQAALAYERQSLDSSAADAYSAALADATLDEAVRYQAALHLTRIEQDRLNDPRAAEAALEKAWLFAPIADRDLIALRIEKLRGYPVRAIDPGPIDLKALLKSDQAAKEQTDKGRRVIAQVGGQAVTFEDLIYAWSQTHGNQPPNSEAFGPFVSNYLSMTLLADEAERLGLDQRGGASLALRMNRTLSLSRAMEEQLIAKLPDATEAQLRAYYNANIADWTAPRRMKLGHIVVADQDKVDAVTKALKDKDPFDDIAKRFSRDAGKLEDNYILGEVAETDDAVPHLAPQPGLVPFLFALDDNQTTGPLKMADGYHWFKVLRKDPAGAAAPFEAVRDQVALRYQQGALARSRAALLAQLRASRPIEIRDATLNKIIAGGDAATTATATATPTPVAAPAPEASTQPSPQSSPQPSPQLTPR